MSKRRRFKQTTSLEERLAEEARHLREEAELLPHGPVRDAALRRAREAETGAHISDWLRSPGLQPPK
ncbi:hypothetical protein [Bradyrhizobium liaoningense]|uniref:hypothetical protein n=1 Tax=Bradyrhizobium liaoningense TaxID=43992 RepID=UPI0020116418|nr:hypothetical protein [Bradyrhizobium liaoningense]